MSLFDLAPLFGNSRAALDESVVHPLKIEKFLRKNNSRPTDYIITFNINSIINFIITFIKR